MSKLERAAHKTRIYPDLQSSFYRITQFTMIFCNYSHLILFLYFVQVLQKNIPGTKVRCQLQPTGAAVILKIRYWLFIWRHWLSNALEIIWPLQNGLTLLIMQWASMFSRMQQFISRLDVGCRHSPVWMAQYEADLRSTNRAWSASCQWEQKANKVAPIIQTWLKI